MTILTIALLAVLIIRRTKLSLMVAGIALVGEAVVSNWSPITSQVSQGLWLTGLNLLLAIGCLMHWKNNNNEVSKYITWLAFAAAFLSFTRLTVFSLVYDIPTHEVVQGFIMSCVDWVVITDIACLLLLPDKAVTIHDLATDIRHGFIRVRDRIHLLTNKSNEP